MKILVCNLGSTSFKYRLYAVAGEESEPELIAKGGTERVESFGPVIDAALEELTREGWLEPGEQLAGVGFKTVLAGEVSGCVEADEQVLQAMESFREVAPAHNPAYVAGIRQFRQRMPGVPLIALFETAFYQWMPEKAARYAVPVQWHEAGIRRYGFHGASHKFIAERSSVLLQRPDVTERVRGLYSKGPVPLDPQKAPLRVISCHLGGSSSVTAIRDGVALGNSMGLSPQSGLPQNNRVGDLDSMALPFAVKRLGLKLTDAEAQLATQGGLLGLSGVSNDIRDIKAAAARGNARARLALDVYVHSIRHWAGAYFWQMGGADAIVFTGGIGEHNPDIREAVCAGLEGMGIELNPDKNRSLIGSEGEIQSANSRTRIYVIPANEEVVIAREVERQLRARYATSTDSF